MTAKFLHSFPARNALRVVNQNLKMTIVTSILYLLGLPMIMAVFMWECIRESHNWYDYDVEMYVFIGGLCLAAAVFMGMIAAINSFKELHSKTRVDMLYSLPLTGKQRFFSDYLGGCVMYILPYIISVILGWIIFLVMNPFVDTTSAAYYVWDAQKGSIAKYYALVTFGLLALMILYFTLSTFVTVCCGTLFESIYTNILLNFLIPGTMAAILLVISNHVNLDFEYMWQCIGFMSPIGGLIYMFVIVFGSGEYGFYYSYSEFRAVQTTSHAMMPSYLRWIFAILIISALLLIAAWQLYVRRKAEHVSKPFVYLAAYYVMLTLLTMAILCLMDASITGPVLLFAAIVYFVMEVIRKRGFKKFWLTIITYIATVGVTIGIFAIVINTGCFGRVNYVPLSAGISSVQVRLPLAFQEYGDTILLEYTDRDVISAMTDLHRDLVSLRKGKNSPVEEINAALEARHLVRVYYNEEYNNNYYADYATGSYSIDEVGRIYYDGKYESYYRNNSSEETMADYANTYYIEISYFTLTGSIIHRSYRANSEEYIKLLDIIHGTDLYAEAMATGLEQRLESYYREYSEKEHTSRIPDRINFSINGEGNYSSYGYSSNASQERSVSNAPQFISDLVRAYRNDASKATAEQYRTEGIYCAIRGIPVYNTFTETIALLESRNFRPFTVTERYNFRDYNYNTGCLGIRIYTPDTYSAASVEYPNSTANEIYFKSDTDGTPAYQDSYQLGFGWSIEEFYPELYALLEACRPYYITTDACYAVLVNGVTYILPAEDTELAEAVIAKGNNYALQEVKDNVKKDYDQFYGYDFDFDYDYDNDTYFNIPPTSSGGFAEDMDESDYDEDAEYSDEFVSGNAI